MLSSLLILNNIYIIPPTVQTLLATHEMYSTLLLLGLLFLKSNKYFAEIQSTLHLPEVIQNTEVPQVWNIGMFLKNFQITNPNSSFGRGIQFFYLIDDSNTCCGVNMTV